MKWIVDLNIRKFRKLYVMLRQDPFNVPYFVAEDSVNMKDRPSGARATWLSKVYILPGKFLFSFLCEI